MRISFILVLGLLGVDAVGAEPRVDAVSTNRPPLQTQRARTVSVYRPKPTVLVSGLFASAVKNPLQLFNPFAPDAAEKCEANTVRHPLTGRAEGVMLLGIKF